MTTITAEWTSFFGAEASAAAALAGLVFVAVSINLERILEFPQLPLRVFEALITLLSVLVVASFALIPWQPAYAYGLEIGCTGLVVWAAKTWALLRSRHPRPVGRRRRVARLLVNQTAPLPYVIGGAMLVAGNAAGLYWVVAGTLLSFMAGMFDAWVLLIEIKR
jgi:modulator of FtsH protease